MVTETTSRRSRAAPPLSRWTATWPKIHRELYELGCDLTEDRRHTGFWRVKAYGVDISVDLVEREIIDFGFSRHRKRLGDIPNVVRAARENLRLNTIITRNPKLVRSHWEWEEKIRQRTQQPVSDNVVWLHRPSGKTPG